MSSWMLLVFPALMLWKALADTRRAERLGYLRRVEQVERQRRARLEWDR